MANALPTVLIVDDEPANRALVVTLLRYIGHQALEANNGSEALELVRQTRPDLVVCDLLMPVMDGYEFVRQLRADPAIAATPVIFYTATYLETEARTLAAACGVSHLLFKPCEPEVILATIAEALKQPVPAAPVSVSVSDAANFDREHLRLVTDKLACKVDELEDANLRLRQMADNIHEVFFLTDPTGSVFHYVSRAFAEVFGRSCESLYAQPQLWLEAIHPDDRARVAQQRGSGAPSFEREYRILRPDGSQRTLRSRGFPVSDASGSVYRIAGIAEDVTQQKLAEQKIQRLNRVYEMLSSINSLIVRASSRAQLLHESCRVAVEIGQYRLSWIGLLEEGATDGRVLAWYGDDGGHARLVRFTKDATAPYGQRPASLALQSLQAVVSNHVAAEPRLQDLRDAMLARGLQSQACFPLVIDKQAVGVLTLCSSEQNAFDAQEIRLLSELSGNISFALDHIQKGERLNYLAYYDALTGLPNSALLNERLEQSVATSLVERRLLALVLIDVERFKEVNQACGRQGGDALLRLLAERLGASADGRWQVARVGADRFALLLRDIADAAEVGRLLTEHYRSWFGPPFAVQGQALHVAARLGIAVHPADGADAETLFRNAESAVKKAKASTERMVFYDARMAEVVGERLALEARLRVALERDEFVLHYQAKVDVDSGRLEGLEALMRWNSPDLGLVQPVRFIPLLEETGLIVEVGLWALRRAAQDHARWQALGLAAPRIAVNVSAVQLREPDFVAKVAALLAGQAASHGIDIELTESVLMEDIASNIDKLHALRALGLRLSIDDFGTGYSSLAYLSKLPAEILKIDRTFISTMLDDPNTMTLVSTMISLAHSLRMKVVAEGVETEEQARMLRLLRCDQMQGYLIGRPVAFDSVQLTP